MTFHDLPWWNLAEGLLCRLTGCVPALHPQTRGGWSPGEEESRCWDHSNVAALSTGRGVSLRGRGQVALELSFHGQK